MSSSLSDSSVGIFDNFYDLNNFCKGVSFEIQVY